MLYILKFFKNLLNSFLIALVSILKKDPIIIKIYGDKNIKKISKYNILIKLAMLNLKNYFLFIIFLISYLIICIYYI